MPGRVDNAPRHLGLLTGSTTAHWRGRFGIYRVFRRRKTKGTKAERLPHMKSPFDGAFQFRCSQDHDPILNRIHESFSKTFGFSFKKLRP